MNRKKLFNFAFINFICGIFVLAVAFFFFHFVTDTGITTTFQQEAGKPFVTMLIGMFGVLFMFSSVTSIIIALVFFEKGKKEEK